MAVTDTRRRILDAALACFLEDGYERATIAQIRERSDVSNGALFHHFASKEAIVGALYVDAIASFHEGLWEILRRRPRSLRAAVRATIGHQLEWIEQNADVARFVYMRGHLDWEGEVEAMNRELAAAFRDWMAPLVERGEIRAASIRVISAVVSGPAHAISRRWLADQLSAPPTAFLDELADAAWAGLRGRPLSAPTARPIDHDRGRVTLELRTSDGDLMAHASADLVPVRRQSIKEHTN